MLPMAFGTHRFKIVRRGGASSKTATPNRKFESVKRGNVSTKTATPNGKFESVKDYSGKPTAERGFEAKACSNAQMMNV